MLLENIIKFYMPRELAVRLYMLVLKHYLSV